MRTVGIICEYNPFHTGHKRQIDILRSMGYDCIVCVMSGNYTQRGELAIFDKYTRAEGALLCGADVVLELPFPILHFPQRVLQRAVFIFSPLSVSMLSALAASAVTLTCLTILQILFSRKNLHRYTPIFKKAVLALHPHILRH